MIKWIKRNLLMTIVTIITVILCGFLVYKNYSSCSFLKVNIVDIVSILLGVFIAFCLTERMTKIRRRNDCIEHIINEIESYVLNDSTFKPSEETLIKQQSCGNRIKYLKDAKFTDINDDIEFIDRNFKDIRDLYSNHYTNEDELKKISIDINKRRENIVDKCVKIRVHLYS